MAMCNVCKLCKEDVSYVSACLVRGPIVDIRQEEPSEVDMPEQQGT